MDIIITGASGFVGSNLISHLKGLININIRQLNLREDFEGACFNKGDVVIHLAGKAHDLKKSDNDKEYFRVNTELTKSLFDIFIRSDARDFVYFSSVKAAADMVDEILTEDVPSTPGTPYGLSKLKAEEYLLSHKLPNHKRLFIIRPCMIHGPGNKGNLNLLYKVVSRRFPYPLAAFDNKRSFLSITNLNFIIEKLILNPAIAGGIYNVADDATLSTNQVISVISKAIGKRPLLWKLNRTLIKILAKIGDVLRLPLNSERLKKLTKSYVVSNDKIKKALAIKHLPQSAEDGLFTTIRSFRDS